MRVEEQGFGTGGGADPACTAEQGAVGHTGGGEEDVTLHEIGKVIFAVEIGDARGTGAGDLVVIAEHQPPLELAAHAAQGGGREHPFGGSVDAEIHVDAGLCGLRGVHDACDIAIGDQPNGGAGVRTLSVISTWRRRSRMQTVIWLAATPRARARACTFSAGVASRSMVPVGMSGPTAILSM